jgi:hypothetical protein
VNPEQRDDEERDGGDHPDDGDGHRQVERGGNRVDVCAGVDGVGAEETEHRRVEEFARVVLSEHAGQPHAADHADLRAAVLHERHHRQRQVPMPEGSSSAADVTPPHL